MTEQADSNNENHANSKSKDNSQSHDFRSRKINLKADSPDHKFFYKKNGKTKPKKLAWLGRNKVLVKEHAESSGIIYTGPEVSPAEPFKLSAHDILVKSEEEIKKLQEAKKIVAIEKEEKDDASKTKKDKVSEDEESSKRETHNLLKQMKIMTAIMLGKDKNKDLSRVLNTDKSFTSKQIKELEDQGLITKETEGREVRYSVDKFNLMKFLQQKVVIKWKSEQSKALQDLPVKKDDTAGKGKEETKEEKEKDDSASAKAN